MHVSLRGHLRDRGTDMCEPSQSDSIEQPCKYLQICVEVRSRPQEPKLGLHRAEKLVVSGVAVVDALSEILELHASFMLMKCP